MSQNQSFLDKFTEISARVGNQVHLRSLRDAFSTIMPMFILAGLAVLVNNVIFPWFLTGDTLTKFQVFGNVIVNGTLNVSSILIAATIAYCLSKNKNFENPISTVPVALATLIVMMAIKITVTPIDAKEAVTVSGVLSYTNLGTQGMFAGIIVGLLATELYMFLAKLKFLQINLGENIPPAVGRSFSVMLPTMITLSIFAIVSAVLASVFNTDLISIISAIIQEPLRRVNTSLLGFILIYSTGNFLFTLGIHQTVINGSLLDPLLLVNMNENMAAVNAGEVPKHIINSNFVTVYTQMGGTGGTIALILAVLLFIKFKPYREVAKLGAAPGIFEINEPIIFGLPIVFNIPMMIPFVLSPVIGALIGYFATFIGFVQPLSVYIPWTTPPIISGYLASAGDLKVVFVQIIIIIATTAFYIPFLKISERVALKQMETK
ncbi:PTS sugar transporter subunit IIC [Streptococcus massiliensis]|uniref:Permease IIC component n=1 Tax=Streptococcus massiliensis TaxID=313439 RepID=A0A380KXK1_9STRE|nr:PTS transporter subunit EIIC [Streptococcus massiliensis]SUN76418.1 PTS system lactose/cellobiose specific IIC component [Streptococcus massiliensis]